MKKMLLALCFVSAVLACATPPQDSSNPMDINAALQFVSSEIATHLPEGAKIAVLNVAGAPTEALANYMLNEIVDVLVSTGKFTLLDRDKTNKAMINTEIGYQQITGEVNEDNQVRIGENLGAQIIITCMLEDIGDYYRIRLRSLEIQGRKMIAARSVNMKSTDKVLARALEFAALIPGKPEIPALSYSKTGFSNTRYLNISWKKAPKATAYYVYIAESPVQPLNPTLTEKNTSCKVEVREKRKQYIWIQATNSTGGSPLSEMAISNPNY
ncbi:MAG: penicillin-binding protein activator LpoB [Treponema sp.]|jgi:hypothetical protein|nr:penicillin-binding protein activator LpoB [Treponema sp.]